MENAKVILWLAKTSPLPAQRAELEVLYPGHTLEIDNREYRSAEELVVRIRASKCDEVVAMVPWSLLSQLCSRGIYPLYARIRRVKGKIEHVAIERCEGVDLKLRKIVTGGGRPK